MRLPTSVFILVLTLHLLFSVAESQSYRVRSHRLRQQRRHQRRQPPPVSSPTSAPASYLPSFVTSLLGLDDQPETPTPIRSGRSGGLRQQRPRRRFPTRPIPQYPLGSQLPAHTGRRYKRKPGNGGLRTAESSRRRTIGGATRPPLGLMSSRLTTLPGITLPVNPAITSTVPRVSLAPNFIPTPPQSLEGWLSQPTEAPTRPKRPQSGGLKRNPVPTKKSGVCGNAVDYGIQCKGRMDQCENDSHCPGTTRCCMVGDCGNLCIKPTRSAIEDPKKKWLGASNVLMRQKAAEKSRVEMSTTSFGLKVDDIAAAAASAAGRRF